jgi:hypothetical protein
MRAPKSEIDPFQTRAPFTQRDPMEKTRNDLLERSKDGESADPPE